MSKSSRYATSLRFTKGLTGDHDFGQPTVFCGRGCRGLGLNGGGARVFVRPNTVVSWQRKRFRDHWTRLSRQGKSGRPRVAKEIFDLIRLRQALRTGPHVL